jgi:hypothetical protein
MAKWFVFHLLIIGMCQSCWAQLRGENSTPATITFSGPKPWIDPTFVTYGAHCDGSTDDSAALQSALYVAIANGGSLVIPDGMTCVVASNSSPALNADKGVNISIIGGIGGGSASRPGGGSTLSPRLLFTGTPAIAIGARGSNGISLKRLVIEVKNQSFTGVLLDTSHFPGDARCGGRACDTHAAVIENNTFIGVPTAAMLVNFDKTIISRIVGNSFFSGTVQLGGAAGRGSYSNEVRVMDNAFNGSASVKTMIQNPGEAWEIGGNAFELNRMASGSSILGCSDSFLDSQGSSFHNSWIGDSVGSPTMTLLNICGSGFSVASNKFSISNTNATLISLAPNLGNFDARGNSICAATAATAFALSTGDVVAIKNDTCSSTLTKFLTGTPASGSIVTDPTGNTTFYGPVQLGRLLAVKGTLMTAEKITLSPGWGNAARVTNVAGTDSAFRFHITPNGTGMAANPTVTITYSDGTWTNLPITQISSFNPSTVVPDWYVAGSSNARSLVLGTNATRSFIPAPGGGFDVMITNVGSPN